MLNVPVYNEAGQQVGTEELDEALLGGRVNVALLKQAIVMFQANQRQGHAVNKSRADVEGSTRKLYRQKGTGRARMGNARTPVRRGGGNAFAKRVREYRQTMPKKMRRLARNQAILAKMTSDAVLILDGVAFDAPKTKRFATMLRAIKSERCIFAIQGLDPLLYKSARNMTGVVIRDVAELNAYEILSKPKLVFTRAAFATLRQASPAAAAGD
jgi:large subunit ribosomal protein L4